MGCILNSPNSNALSCKKFHRIGLSICKPGKGNGHRHRFLFVPYRESLHSPAAFWVCPGKSFFLSFLFPGGCSMGCPPDTPPGRRFHIFGGRSQTPLGSGSPIPMPTSPFIGSFFGQCRRNSCRRHRSHFGNAADYPAGFLVNGMLFMENLAKWIAILRENRYTGYTISEESTTVRHPYTDTEISPEMKCVLGGSCNGRNETRGGYHWP